MPKNGIFLVARDNQIDFMKAEIKKMFNSLNEESEALRGAHQASRLHSQLQEQTLHDLKEFWSRVFPKDS